MRLKLMAMAVRVALGAGLVLGLTRSIDKAAWEKLAKDVQALYKEQDGKYVLDLEGEEDNGALKSALEKERVSRRDFEKQLKELGKKFEGVDPDEFRKMMDRIGGDEEAKLLKEGKFDEWLAKRTEKMKKEFDRQVGEMNKKVDGERARADKFAQRVLDNHVRAAATKAGLHPNAVEDALFRARTMFVLNEDGDAVQLDKDGHAVVGKDGKTPFNPGEWLEAMKETAPHWYPAGSAGSGALGSKDAQGKKSLKRAAFNQLSPLEQSAYSKEVNAGKAVLVD